jgi:hypothetical protein
MRLILALFFFGVTLAPGLSFADNERSFGLVDRLPGEDPACDAVNRAYEKTSNLGRYTIYVGALKPDGTIAPFEEDWIEQQNEYLDYPGDKGFVHRRPLRLTTSSVDPVFRACRLIGNEETARGPALHFAGTWHRGFTSLTDIWVSMKTGRILQISRTFSHLQSPFPFDKTMELYDYPFRDQPADSLDPILEHPPLVTQAQEPSASELRSMLVWPLPEDKFCRDVYLAFRSTYLADKYTYEVTEIRPGQQPIPAREAVKIERSLYSRVPGRRWGLEEAYAHPIGQGEPIFHDCKLVSSAAGILHYTAYWKNPGKVSDIWVSAATGLFVKTEQPTTDALGALLKTDVQVYDYNPIKAVVPPE